jgi:hypothetical protein
VSAQHQLAQAVSRFCADRFDDVTSIVDLVLPTLSGPSPARADLAIEQHCRGLLSDVRPPLAGAGVVVSPHVLADAPYWLEWWVPGTDDEVRRLAVDLDPASLSFRDYSTLAWFEEPQRTGERAITGPYVDYLCTDQYTLTFTTPLLVEDRFVGVAGVDVLARWFEQHLLSGLDLAAHDGLAVVNRAGRVVTCPDGSWVTGDLVRTIDEWEQVPCPGTPFAVARQPGRS